MKACFAEFTLFHPDIMSFSMVGWNLLCFLQIAGGQNWTESNSKTL
jgi:hypothetical protein